jgi:hypothetical protein
MPRGPKGEKRPADVNARAVMIAKIATGEIEDPKSGGASAACSPRWPQGRERLAPKNYPPRNAAISAKKAASMRWAARSR